jgi:hypothetical protein
MAKKPKLAVYAADNQALLTFMWPDGKVRGFLARGRDEALFLLRSHAGSDHPHYATLEAMLNRADHLQPVAEKRFQEFPSDAIVAIRDSIRHCVATLGENLQAALKDMPSSSLVFLELHKEWPSDYACIGLVGKDGAHVTAVVFSLEQHRALLEEIGDTTGYAHGSLRFSAESGLRETDTREPIRFSGALAAQCNVGATLLNHFQTVAVAASPRDDAAN